MRRRITRPRALLGAALLPLALAACGDDDGDDGSSSSELIDAMVAEGASEEEARCFVDELGDDAERLYGAAEDELSEGEQARLINAVVACAEGVEVDASDE